MGSPFSLQIAKPVGREAFEVCSVAGVNLMSKEQLRFRQLADMMNSNIRALQDANAMDKWSQRAILGASLIKATCEAFVEMAGTLGEEAGIKGAKDAALGLGLMTKSADYAIGKASGQKTDGFGLTKSFADAALEKSKLSGVNKNMAEIQSIKVDIVKNAVSNDTQGVKKEVFLAYLPKIAEMTLAAVKKEASSKLVAAAGAIAKSGASYSDALDKAFDEKIEAEGNVADRTQLIKELEVNLRVVTSQIKIIDQILADCSTGKALRSPLA